MSASFSPAQVRALTWQDFNDATRNMNGTQLWYIDDLSITYQVPEPASLGLLSLSVPALLAQANQGQNRLIAVCQSCLTGLERATG